MRKIIGYRKVDYTRSRDGRHIEGAEIYSTIEDESSDVVGVGCEMIYVNKDTVDRIVNTAGVLSIDDLIGEVYSGVQKIEQYGRLVVYNLIF